jgi:hypothetical protein
LEEHVKVLTVHPEWAYAIIHLGKDAENRSWAPPPALIGQDLAIHASARRGDTFASFFITNLGSLLPENLPHGAVVGVVTVKDAHNSGACFRTGNLSYLHPEGPYRCSPWGLGGATGHGPQMHWELTDPRPCEPVPCKGRLGIWTAPDEVAAEVYRTLTPRSEITQ